MNVYYLLFVIAMIILLSVIGVLLAVYIDTKIASKRYKKLADEIKKEGFKYE